MNFILLFFVYHDYNLKDFNILYYLESNIHIGIAIIECINYIKKNNIFN